MLKPVVAGVPVDMPGLDDLSKDDKRRVLNRVRQREYRRMDLEELRCLRAHVASLEATYSALTVVHGQRDAMAMLPWKDIASGLYDDAKMAVAKHKVLRDQLTYYRGLARVLASFVARLGPSLELLPPGDTRWHALALPADDNARCLAMDWLMTRLYHNTQGTFQANAFPSTTASDFADINIYLDDGKFQFVVRSQRLVNIGLDHVDRVYGAFCDDVTEIGVENSTGNWVSRMDQEVLAGRNLVYGRQTLIKGVEQHYLCRRYDEPGKLVLVGQNIVEDAKYPSSHRGMYEETGWRVVESLGPDQVIIKDCITVTPLVATDGSGYLPLEAYAAFFGIEVSADEDYLTVANFRRRLQRFFGYIDRDLREYMGPITS
ncbi:hypothetical protein ACHHYP_03418 [Achlya hypogyna]|uniref:Uncharacterized protein n=1 Tax=Achlya hypogyna TaxID=1202772 RepID=A0A1V9ZRD9_ACHHY|nr:hypothetical protein ACHHYP_03418 [Achlya hypogyna]